MTEDFPDIAEFRAKAARLASEIGAKPTPVAILLALPYCGRNAAAIGRLVGLSQPSAWHWLQRVKARLTDDNGRFYCQWLLDGFAGEVAFTLDVLVLTGKARRFLDTSGAPLYVTTETVGQVLDPADPSVLLKEGQKLSARREGLIPMKGSK